MNTFVFTVTFACSKAISFCTFTNKTLVFNDNSETSYVAKNREKSLVSINMSLARR